TSFQNYTGQINYQHTYPKQGKEFTTSLTLNGGQMNTTYTYTTYQEKPALPQILQTSNGSKPSWMYTYQADFVNPINDYTKFETGVRSFMQKSYTTQQTFNKDSVGDMVAFTDLTNNYTITNLTNAAYANYNSRVLGINYQAGLRFEESYYKGEITNKNLSFSYMYPD